MSKNLSVSLLMDFYGQLLTPKQLEALEYYYNDDLSLAEIADQMSISRQGVRDFIKRSETVMDEMESKLNLTGIFRSIASIEECAKQIKVINKRLSESKDIDSLADEIIDSIQYIENGAE